MKFRTLGSAIAIATMPAMAGAQQPAALRPVQAASLPTSTAVAAFYNTWRASPIWFRGNIPNAAAGQLVAILKRAAFDGFASGPQLATEVEAALARVASGKPEDVTAAEQTLSAAWVAYVQAIKRPTPNMIYAYPVLRPQNTRADQILLTAFAAPSLDAHLRAVSDMNPVYAQIRNAAFLQAQASGNMTPDPRLLSNLDRARSIPAGGKFIIVDSASQRLTMFENGQPVDSMKVVVGDKKKLGLPTPLIASIMHYVTLNPYWNVPHHLVRKTVAPNVVKQGLGYLKKNGYEIMSDWTETATVLPPDSVDWKAVAAGEKQVRVRQKPGPTNSMGRMKFPFPSGEDIYLHDTPTREYFNRAQRTLSNGCVRVEDAKRLGRWLLGREPVAASEEAEQRVQIPQGVPIFLTYLTAQPTSAGVNYLADVYGWDSVPEASVASVN